MNQMSNPNVGRKKNLKMSSKNMLPIKSLIGGVLVKILASVKGKLFIKPPPASRSFRFLALQLEREKQGLPWGMAMVVTTPSSSRLSINTSLLLSNALRAELGAKVLLVDASFDQQGVSLTSRLGLAGVVGFSDNLCGRSIDETSPCATALPNIYCLPFGNCGVSCGVVNETILNAFFEAMRVEYDFVIFHQGSVTKDTRYLKTSKKVDVNLLVCEEGMTLMSEVDNTKLLLEENKIENMRLVISNSK